MTSLDPRSGPATVLALARAARTASGTAAVPGNYRGENKLRAQLNVTAVAGVAPTLDVVLEDTLDGETWNVVATFAQRGGIGREVVNASGLFTDRLRARWSVAGTSPSFTFDLHLYSEP